MADFEPVEADKAHILLVRSVPPNTPIDEANRECVDVRVDISSDLANWRVPHLRAMWRAEVAKPVEWEWVYTWGSPSFVRQGEIYRIHSGSRARAATHPMQDDLATGRIQVYVAGPAAAARLLWSKGDYVRLVDAFGTVIDEVVVWPEQAATAPAAEAKGPARGSARA